MNRKSLTLITLIVGLQTSVLAHARLDEGTQEIGVQGKLDLDAADDYQLNLDVSYGVFLKDDIEVGGQLGVSASDSYKNFSLGAFAEYNFDNESRWVPFVGAAAALGSTDFNNNGDDIGLDLEDATALNIDLSFGLKAFINDNVAISGKFIHTFSTEDIHYDGDEVKDSASTILFGTRFYF